MQVQSLGWEDPLEEGMATHAFQYSCLQNQMDRGAEWAMVLGVTKSLDTTEVTQHTHMYVRILKKGRQNLGRKGEGKHGE